jgi:hypothetical protein
VARIFAQNASPDLYHNHCIITHWLEGNPMDFDFTFTFIIAFICIIIGFAIGRLLNTLREPEKDDAESEHPDWEKVMQIWREPKKRDLIVTIGDFPFTVGSEVNPKTRDHILKTVQKLHNWLVPPHPIQEEEPTPELKPILRDYEEETPKEPPIDIPLPTGDKPVPQVFNPSKMITNAMLFDIPDSAFKADSIVEQIDNILQLILKENKMEDSAVRLMDMPNKGMVVAIGLDMYDEIDDIPDLSIKTLIRQAVWLWENRKERPED